MMGEGECQPEWVMIEWAMVDMIHEWLDKELPQGGKERHSAENKTGADKLYVLKNGALIMVATWYQIKVLIVLLWWKQQTHQEQSTYTVQFDNAIVIIVI